MYVLGNARKHLPAVLRKPGADWIDPYSSAVATGPPPARVLVAPPTTWLLMTGLVAAGERIRSVETQPARGRPVLGSCLRRARRRGVYRLSRKCPYVKPSARCPCPKPRRPAESPGPRKLPRARPQCLWLRLRVVAHVDVALQGSAPRQLPREGGRVGTRDDAAKAGWPSRPHRGCPTSTSTFRT
jgi:hypothetical protein